VKPPKLRALFAGYRNGGNGNGGGAKAKPTTKPQKVAAK
jgi:hypothetical protein